MTQDSVTLAFVGDVMLGRRVDAALAGCDPAAVWGDTVPSERRARLWKVPAATATTPVSPTGWTGAVRVVVVPSPSWP